MLFPVAPRFRVKKAGRHVERDVVYSGMVAVRSDPRCRRSRSSDITRNNDNSDDNHNSRKQCGVDNVLFYAAGTESDSSLDSSLLR